MNEQGSTSVRVQDENRSLSWLLFSFEGRIPRSTWWAAGLALSGLSVILELGMASGALSGGKASEVTMLIFLLWLPISFWMGIALNA